MFQFVFIDLSTLLLYMCWPCLALGNGDPHFISMDGQRFSFNGLGEYMLMDAYDATSDTSVVVQIRTQLVLASGATSVSAFAAGFYTGRFPCECFRIPHIFLPLLGLILDFLMAYMF